ncbi:hypothetical protein MKX33_13310 [Paenibacillus sp. FSL R5-0490]
MDTRILEVKTILILLGSWRICCDGAGWDRFFVVSLLEFNAK